MADFEQRILVVDDEHAIRTMLSGLLRKRGVTVDEAHGGREAIELLRMHRYSVVLLDLLMPEPNGFDVLDTLKTTTHTPVVLVLTGADRSVIDRLDSDFIHGVVRKPFDPEELVSLAVACSEVRGRGGFGVMSAALICGARLLDLLQ
jgi:two-component system response regulator VicR